MLFISSKIPEDYKVVNAPELADRVYPGVEYPVLDENDMIRVYVPLDISPDLITGHTVKATEIAELMINKLLEDDGTAELFPYNMVDIIKEKFGMN